MKIEYRTGDLLTFEGKYIAHCVNAQGAMNSGVAKEIRAAYPKAFDVYRVAYIDKYNRNMPTGIVIGANCGKHIVLNVVGQKNYGYDGRTYLDYRALRKGIGAINRNVSEPVAFPLIGCGLAGGDWGLVSEILEEESTNFQPIVYTLNDEIPY